ncbi:C4-dicarboxylate transport protein [Paenibacillus solanacearum]|uniref:C4-dicarboxylate transport protein n=1 Tax=Paenibacillus solanacearum TaxID=2048548 RepID=A0A916JYB1_9BACL|nr:C4-dicarboxylate transport protein [Paenibacillus solanacearum]
MRINFKNLTVQVLIAIVIGIFIGQFFPAFGVELKVLGDIFVKLIKMVIAPIVFFTIVIGFANMGDMKKIGRIGGKALLYFEIVTTFAMAIGIAVMYIVRPGTGMDISKVGATASWNLCSASFRTAWSAPLPRAKCFPSCSSPSCSVLPWPDSAKRPSLSPSFSRK